MTRRRARVLSFTAIFLGVADPGFAIDPPTTVYCINGRRERPEASRGFNAGAFGWVLGELGMLGPHGEAPGINVANEVVNSEGIIVGRVLTGDQGQIIGFTNNDGTMEAYDLDAGFSADDAWLRVARGGRFVIAKHGTTKLSASGTIVSTGITLDNGRSFPGFRATASTGDGTGQGGTPYELTPRPDANITVDLNGCYTSLDPDGADSDSRRSVIDSIASVPGVHAVTGNSAKIYKGGFSLDGTPEDVARAYAALRDCAFDAGFYTLNPDGSPERGNIGAWIQSMRFADQLEAIRQCFADYGIDRVVPSMNSGKYTSNDTNCVRSSGDETLGCQYYLPVQLIGGSFTSPSTVRYAPPDNPMLEAYFPPGSTTRPIPIQIQPLPPIDLPPVPPGTVPLVHPASIHSYDDLPADHGPALMTFQFGISETPPLGVFQLAGDQWFPIDASIDAAHGLAQFTFTGPTVFCILGVEQPACRADYTHDGSIDGDDVIAFFQDWDAGVIAADYTADGSVDGDDVIGFFGDWDTQCGG